VPFPATTGWRAALAVLVVAVCGLAFTPVPPPEADTGWDKANHVLAFAVLTACAVRAFPAAGAVALAVTGLAFGGFIEGVQSQIPGRSAEWADVLADAVGIAIGLMAMLLRRR
jgi:VanZ family protein